MDTRADPVAQMTGALALVRSAGLRAPKALGAGWTVRTRSIFCHRTGPLSPALSSVRDLALCPSERLLTPVITRPCGEAAGSWGPGERVVGSAAQVTPGVGTGLGGGGSLGALSPRLRVRQRLGADGRRAERKWGIPAAA